MNHSISRTIPAKKSRLVNVLPGFPLTLGYTIFYLCLIVLIPLSAVFFKTSGMGWAAFWDTVTNPRIVATYKISFDTSFLR